MNLAGSEFILRNPKIGSNFKRMNCLLFRKVRERLSKKRSLTYWNNNFNGHDAGSIMQLVRLLSKKTSY